ncbi:MAG: hypothetical protein AAF960_19185 [Bacteroidota bacterium]
MLFLRIEHLDRLSTDETVKYQNRRLKILLHHANKIPYYANLIQRRGINVEAENAILELSKFLILTKETIKFNQSDFEIDKKLFKNIQTVHTSGTTGSGFIFWRQLEAELNQWAVWWRYRQVHGIFPDTWCGYFGGRSIVPVNQQSGKFYRINVPGKQVMFSIYHLNATTVFQYYEVIRAKKLTWLHGYPSMLSLLSTLICEQQLSPLLTIKNISTGAENLLAYQVDTIKKAFPNARLTDYYGQAEGVANISQCEYGNYHIDEDYSIVELLPLDKNSNKYRLIGTSLTNLAHPFIRYDTGDIVTYTSRKCTYGRISRVIDNIDGRNEDYITTLNDSKIGRLDHVFKGMVNIKEAQIIQKNRQAITINIVKRKAFNPLKDEKRLIRELRKRIGNEIAVHLNLVNLKKSDTFKTVVPSKIFESAAMAKPILLGAEGEAKGVIELYNAGLCFEPQNTADFLAHLRCIHSDKALYKNFQKGCLRIASEFNRKSFAWMVLEIIMETVYYPETVFTVEKRKLQPTKTLSNLLLVEKSDVSSLQT